MFRPWEDPQPGTSRDYSADQEDYSNTAPIQKKTSRQYLGQQAQKIVKNVYKNIVASEGQNGALEKTSYLTEVPTSTIYRIIKREAIKRQKRSDLGTSKEIDSSYAKLLRDTIYDKYKKNEIPTVESLHTELELNGLFSVSKATLWRWLKKIGFGFKVINKRAMIMESRRIVLWRMEYLESIQKFRNEQRPIYYLDETWYDTHDTVKRGWTDDSDRCKVDMPPNRGTRLIILHCGTEKGWVPNCLKLSGKKLEDSSVDYHQNMNADIFEEWFKDCLLPNVERNSVIVLDNAPYHSRLLEKIPNRNSKKKDIQEFKKIYNIGFQEHLNKDKLLKIIERNHFSKKYVTDEMAKALGHTVLRLPPYFCIFNPIELIWSQLKQGIRRNNTFPKFDAKVIDLINSEVRKVTSDNWKKCIEHVKNVEKEYTDLGNIINPSQDHFVINVNEENSDSDSSSDSDNE